MNPYEPPQLSTTSYYKANYSNIIIFILTVIAWFVVHMITALTIAASVYSMYLILN